LGIYLDKFQSGNFTSVLNFATSQVSLNPVRVLKEEAGEEKAETARLSSFVGAMAVGDLVKSTLGPKGMDKILWGMGRNEGIVEVTNDGATILKAIGVDNPAAKVLVEMSEVQVCQD
jgi:T-complex protein 1 subunit beta